MYYTVIKHNGHLREPGKCRKHKPQVSVFYISQVFSLAVTSRLVYFTAEQMGQVLALAEDIVLCSWGRYLTLTVPLSTQEYK